MFTRIIRFIFFSFVTNHFDKTVRSRQRDGSVPSRQLHRPHEGPCHRRQGGAHRPPLGRPHHSTTVHCSGVLTMFVMLDANLPLLCITTLHNHESFNLLEVLESSGISFFYFFSSVSDHAPLNSRLLPRSILLFPPSLSVDSDGAAGNEPYMVPLCAFSANWNQ